MAELRGWARPYHCVRQKIDPSFSILPFIDEPVTLNSDPLINHHHQQRQTTQQQSAPNAIYVKGGMCVCLIIPS